MALIAVVGGCDQFKKGFDQGFNQSFGKKAHDSCVTSSTSHGAPAAVAEQYCTCVVGQLAPLSTQQKMGLNPSSPELKRAQETCTAQLGQGAPTNAG
jgi:hypothetical protein